MEAKLTPAAHPAAAAPPSDRALTGTSLRLFVGLGVVFWLTAALIVRFAGPAVFSDHNPRLAWFFLLTCPITGAFLFIACHLGRVPYAALLRPVVVMTTTATLLDGVALAWFRQLYAPSFEVALFGAALILWGAGLGLLCALVLDARGAARAAGAPG